MRVATLFMYASSVFVHIYLECVVNLHITAFSNGKCRVFDLMYMFRFFMDISCLPLPLPLPIITETLELHYLWLSFELQVEICKILLFDKLSKGN